MDNLQPLRESLMKRLKEVKKASRKRNLKIVGKSSAAALLIAGGMTVTILFPSPVVVAAVGGVMALVVGDKGIAQQVRNRKTDQCLRKQIKQELKNVDNTEAREKIANEVINVMQSRKEVTPSAPPDVSTLYPSLS